jgi:hypothetical protein
VDFTREPVIETVITPREGCKLVVRSSKSSGQEEYFVDAVEVVSFGHSLFFRSLERPKAFLVPVSDYEILEVREARMVLKNVGVERAIKIGGGREAAPRLPKEVPQERGEPLPLLGEELPALTGEEAPALISEGRLDKKRDRRRHYRRRRGREEVSIKEGESLEPPTEEREARAELRAEPPKASLEAAEAIGAPSIVLSSILPPPPTLISETIARYKDNAMFKGAFFAREEKMKEEQPSEEESQKEPEKQAEKQDWISDEAEEEIFRHRASTELPEEPQPDEPATPHSDPKEGP